MSEFKYVWIEHDSAGQTYLKVGNEKTRLTHDQIRLIIDSLSRYYPLTKPYAQRMQFIDKRDEKA